MVVASHPLAADAGLEMLRSGGHAVDAAIAAAAVLAVVEPAASGLGGDAFLLIFDAGDGAVAAINGSGALPIRFADAAAALPSRHEPASLARGPLSLTVPGCVSAWEEAAYGWGRLDWPDLLEPAHRLADEGYAVSGRLASILRRERALLAADAGLAAQFLDRSGEPLHAGDLCRPVALARTLRHLAEEGAESFYHGNIARRLVRGVRNAGGALSAEDLDRHEAELRAPVEHRLSRAAGGGTHPVTLVEQPLPSQGVLLTIATALLEGTRHDEEWRELHRQVEAFGIVRAVGDLFLGDPRVLPVPEEELVDALLSPATIEAWRGLIGETARGPVPRARTEARARRQPRPGAKKAAKGERNNGAPARSEGGESPPSTPLWRLVWDRFAGAGPAQNAIATAYAHAGMTRPNPVEAGSDTTYLCAVDGDGNAVGLIQSIFHPFGGGFLEPDTGIILNNRGAGFSSDRRSPNRREPGRRARHTLNSWMLLLDDRPWIVGGTPGAMNQITVNLQIVRAVLAGQPRWDGPAPMVEGNWSQARQRERPPLDPADRLAAILEMPRWDLDSAGRLRLEARIPADLRRRLRRAGHDPERCGPFEGAGFVQAIERLPSGSWIGATDPRGEGMAAGF